jgi:hypothetical protein
MDLFTKQDFLRLAEVHNQHCVSIYISTHRLGGDEAELQDRTAFKNQLKEVKRKLKDYKLTDREIENYTKPLNDLLDRENFWRKLSDCLAVFLDGSEVSYYTIPLEISESNYVADHLYLKPLAPLVNRHARFFIMVLSLGNMRFFDASEYNITEVNIEGLIPRGMEESQLLAADENQQQLQWRSQHGEPQQGAMFHGHGGGNESEKKQQIQKYFQEIDRGLMEMLHDEKAPLIVAGVDYLFPIFKDACNYKNLYDHHLVGNFDVIQPSEIHNRVWDLIKNDFKADLEKKKEKYHELLKVDRAAYQLEEVIPGSIVGRTDTLFLEKDRNVWGSYDESSHSITIDEEKNINNACLLNRSAINTIKNGGEVYILDPANMPEDVSTAAIFRYEMK